MIDTLRQDAALAVRSLRSEPGVTLVAFLSLAIGIAANATVFTLVQAVEFPQFIYPRAGGIVVIESRNVPRELSRLPISAPDALDLAAATHTLDTPALTVDDAVTIRETVTPTHWPGRYVTPAFFTVMQVPATHGRLPAAGFDDRTIVVSDRLWRTELGSDPAIVGRVIHVNDAARTVIGVMPSKFDLDADVWMPLADATATTAARDDRRFTMFARLRTGVTFDNAAREIAAVSDRLALDHPATNTGWQMFPTPLTRLHGQDARGMFLLMQGAVAFVLLIACANIANMLLARGTRRAHDMAVRVALGATRARLVRQLLVESLILALTGGAIGSLLTLGGIRLAKNLYEFPEVIDLQLNALVLTFTMALSMLTGVVAGIMPALRASNVAPQMSLQADGGRGSAERAARGRLRAALVAVQVASAVALSSGASLLVQSLLNRQRVDLGFNPAGAIRADLTFSGTRYANVDNRRATAETLLDSLRSEPTVTAAGGQGWALSRGVGARLQVTLPSRGDAPIGAGAPNAVEAITPDYFAAMGVSIKQGRAFDRTDRAGAPMVAIINEEFARAIWPDRSPIGDIVRLGTMSDGAPLATIVGVAGSIRPSAMHGFLPSRIYVPFVQFPSPSLTLVVRGSAEVKATVGALQRALRQADAALVLDGVRPLDTDIARFVAPVRFIAVLFSAFGMTGVLLSALGVFGTMSYAVSQRRREMAVRTALGAGRSDIVRLVVGSGLRITAVGVVIGVVLSIAGTRTLASFLFGVSPDDPVTLGVVAMLLASVSLAACYRPAHIAASVDPMAVLRRE